MCCLNCCKAADLGTHDYCLDFTEDWVAASDQENVQNPESKDQAKGKKPDAKDQEKDGSRDKKEHRGDKEETKEKESETREKVGTAQ
ncbi:hypothetical protein ACO1O0_004465 [Amphichorda felina]